MSLNCEIFYSSRRVRQGDPLSPLLFDIVMEALSHMLDVATTTGWFSGFSIGDSAGSLIIVSHLMFEDDTLIFCDTDTNQIAILHGILSKFEEVSGL